MTRVLVVPADCCVLAAYWGPCGTAFEEVTHSDVGRGAAAGMPVGLRREFEGKLLALGVSTRAVAAVVGVAVQPGQRSWAFALMASIRDRWYDVRDGQRVQSKEFGQGTRYRARYRDAAGKEHVVHRARKADAQAWLDEVTTAVGTGTYVDPKTARLTVQQWCATWREGYAGNRSSTVRQADVHLARIVVEFGPVRLADVRPSQVKAWTARLHAEGLAQSYVYALYRRLAQVFADAVHDGIVPRSPCSRRTAPPMGEQRAYVATTEQVWALYEAFPERQRVAVLLGAMVGLRNAEMGGLRVADVDFLRGVVTPAVQFGGEVLKTTSSKWPVPIPRDLVDELAAQVARWPNETLLTNDQGKALPPWTLDRLLRAARPKIDGLPEDFRLHDLRHYFASLLIASGADVKVVQRRLRHSSAKTSLDTYGHLWPDSDDSTRAAVASVLSARADWLRTSDDGPERLRRSEG